MTDDTSDAKPASKRRSRRATAPKSKAKADPAAEAPHAEPKPASRRRSSRRRAELNESEPVAQQVIETAHADPPDTGSEQNANRPSRPSRAIPDLKARARQREAERPAPPSARSEQIEIDSDDELHAEAPIIEPHRTPPPIDQAPPKALAEHWDEIFGTSTFADLGLRTTLVRAVRAQGFVSPTKIQAAMIPLALAGKDILGQSRTGSGKTAAFGLPVLNCATRGVAYQGLILAPTRELAIQIADELRTFARYTPLTIATVYGGQSIDQQVRRLDRAPEVVVATPGRLMDMLDRGHVHLNNVRFVILDEVDRMLDIGFRDDIRAILSRIRCEHQTIFVSATISPEIEKLARTFMHQDAERIETTGGSLTATLVDQCYISVQPWDKSKLLAYWVEHEAPELALVFCRMKRTVDKLTGRLLDRRINAAAIHGDLPQGKRNRIMDDLRAGKLHILIASDLAARGLDVDGITHVVNFDLPEDPEIYIHRIGRTARAGRGGKAFSFVTPEQGELLTDIEKLANIHIAEKTYPGFVPGPVPEDIRGQRAADEKRIEEMRKRTRASAPELPAVAVAVDTSKFPGGVVPTRLPPRRLGGRVERGR